jgi:hypothetical protein
MLFNIFPIDRNLNICELTIFHSEPLGISTCTITRPSALSNRICKVPPVFDSALTFTDLNLLPPKSTLLYCIHAFAVSSIVFQPSNVFRVSRKATDAPSSLLRLYLSICIFREASVNPTLRNVEITFLKVYLI